MTVEKWLRNAVRIKRKIEACKNNIERWQTILESCTSPTDKVGRGTKANNSEKYMDLIDAESEKIKVLCAESNKYKEVIYKLKDERYQTLLNLKYFKSGLSWKDVALFIGKSVSHTKGYLLNGAKAELRAILSKYDLENL
jgi:hypothetical protein